MTEAVGSNQALMRFALTLSSNLSEDKRALVTKFSLELKNLFIDKFYGSSIKELHIGIECSSPEFAQFYRPRKPKYTKGKKTIIVHGLLFEIEDLLKYDLEIDFASFQNGSKDECYKILEDAIWNSLTVLDDLKKKIPDFDTKKFKADLESFFKTDRVNLPPVQRQFVSKAVLAKEVKGSDKPVVAPAGKKLDETVFWSLIENAKTKSNGSFEKQIKILTDNLSGRIGKEIIGYEFTFREVLMRSYHYNVMAALKIIEGYVSDDSFLYFRCRILALGKEIYYGFIENPDKYADAFTYEGEGEEMLMVADNAFEMIFGDDADPLPRDIASSSIDYDLGPNDVLGEDWVEDKLSEMYPKLYKKYH